jgi:hypothetical protein
MELKLRRGIYESLSGIGRSLLEEGSSESAGRSITEHVDATSPEVFRRI